MSGFIIISRKIRDWEWWDDASVTCVWLHILINANYKDKNWHGVEIPRGSFITSIRHLSEECGISVMTVRRCLKCLEQTGEIKTERTHQGTHIYVLNYAKYQGSRSNSNTPVSTQPIPLPSTQPISQPIHNITKEQRNKGTNIDPPSIPPSTAPSWEEVQSYAEEIGYRDPLPFYKKYDRDGWMINGHPIRDWKALLRAWMTNDEKKARERYEGRIVVHLPSYMIEEEEEAKREKERKR